MTDTQTANIDEVLNKLAEILHGASPAQSQQPSITEPVSSQVLLPTDPEQTMKLREQIATEMMYMQIVPALSEEILIKLDEFFPKVPDLLKSLNNRPYLQAQIDKIVASGMQVSEKSGRSFDSDPELEVLAKRMGQDISGDSGKRDIVIVISLIGALAAGVAVGQAARNKK